MSIQTLCHFLIGLFVFLLLSCMCSLYILDTYSLSGTWLENIFSHSVGWLFILLIVSFLFSLILSHLFIFASVAIAFGVRSKKLLPRAMSRSSLPNVSSRSFMVSDLTLIDWFCFKEWDRKSRHSFFFFSEKLTFNNWNSVFNYTYIK